MNVNIDNLEHVLSTLNGFESLSNGDLESPDSIYTKTVLKLNGVDFKHRAGTEGFVSSVKAGAQKVYEMIKNFIKAIRDFFFGSKGSKQTKAIDDAVKSTQNNSKEIMSKKNDGSFNEENISTLTAYTLEKERIERLMDNEKIKLVTDNYNAFVQKYSDDIFTVGLIGSRLRGIPGISITDLRVYAAQLGDLNSNIGFIAEKYSTKYTHTGDNQRISIFETTPPLVELQKLFNEMRTIATKALADVTKDLEHNNELAKKQENSNDPKSNLHSDKVKYLCRKMVAVSTKLTNLIEYCDSKIIKVKQIMEGVKELTSK